MGVIKGQNLRVMVGSKCVAMATSCTVHLALSLESSFTKDSTNDFDEQDPVSKNWDVSTDSLVTLVDNGSNGETTTDLLDLILNATKVTLVFDQTAGTNNRVGQNSAIKMTGDAYLVDFSVTAAARANSTLSCQFTGTGPLAKASA
jgi:hypothetical protein